MAAAKELTHDELNDLIKDVVGKQFGEQIAEVRNEIKALAERAATPQPGLMAKATFAERPAQEEERGLVAAGFVRCLAALKRAGLPLREMPALAEKQYGKDSAVVRALGATDFDAGGVLVPDQVSAEVIELLRPASVVRKLNPVIAPMDNGKLELPKLTGGATASYIGENQNLPKTQPTFGNVKFTAKKLGALVPVSNDLLRRASPGADGMVRDDLVASIAQRSDYAFIRGDGTQYTPKGIRNWAVSGNVESANATVNLANVTSDLGLLWQDLLDGNCRMLRPAWMFAPRSLRYLATVRDGNGNYAFRDEILRGQLWGYPFGVTTQIPTNLGGGTDESEVYLIDMADAVIAEATQLLLDTSTEAAYHDGSNVVAAFSLDQTVVRAIIEHDFGMRHDESIAILTAVKWAA